MDVPTAGPTHTMTSTTMSKLDRPLCCTVNPYLGCIGCDARVCSDHYTSPEGSYCPTTYYNGWAHDAYGHAWNNIWALPLNRETELKAKQRGEPIARQSSVLHS